MKYFILTIFLLTSSALRASDYLVPIAPFNDLYNQVVYESLIGETNSELWMITRPSFSPEQAIILESVTAEDKNQRGVNGKKLFLKEVLANEMIYKYKKIDDQHHVLDLKKTNNVTIKRIEIDKTQYETIIKAWTAGVRKTRYPENSYGGLDGTTYQFYASYNLYGETWSPKQGIAYNLVGLGQLLSAIVNQPNNTEKLLERANELANEILQTP